MNSVRRVSRVGISIDFRNSLADRRGVNAGEVIDLIEYGMNKGALPVSVGAGVMGDVFGGEIGKQAIKQLLATQVIGDPIWECRWHRMDVLGTMLVGIFGDIAIAGFGEFQFGSDLSERGVDFRLCGQLIDRRLPTGEPFGIGEIFLAKVEDVIRCGLRRAAP